MNTSFVVLFPPPVVSAPHTHSHACRVATTTAPCAHSPRRGTRTARMDLDVRACTARMNVVKLTGTSPVVCTVATAPQPSVLT
jgi:hypothetical protein